MKFNFLQLFILGFVFLFNCSTPKNNDQIAIKKNTKDKLAKNYNTDTVKVDRKTVIFFTLSQQEFDALQKIQTLESM